MFSPGPSRLRALNLSFSHRVPAFLFLNVERYEQARNKLTIKLPDVLPRGHLSWSLNVCRVLDRVLVTCRRR